MFKAPTSGELLRDLRGSIKAEITETDPWIWPNNLVPTLKAFSQALRAAYLRFEVIHEPAFVTTCLGQYLDFNGIQAGGLSREPATYAQGEMEATAVLGSVITDGQVLARSDGQLFTVVGTVTATV